MLYRSAGFCFCFSDNVYALQDDDNFFFVLVTTAGDVYALQNDGQAGWHFIVIIPDGDA